MTHSINPALLDVAMWKLQHQQEAAALQKQAFVPAGDPSGAGAPPGGAPPGAAPPGGAPPGMPMDPSMGGAPPGGPPPFDPNVLMPMIQQAVQQALAGSGAGGAAAGGAPGAPGAAGPGKGAKVDPGLIYLELGRMRKLMTGMYERNQWPLPPDILDDQSVAAVAAGQQPTSQPLGADPAAAGGDPSMAGPATPQAIPGIGGQAPIQPIEGMKTASLHELLGTGTLGDAAGAAYLLLESQPRQ